MSFLKIEGNYFIKFLNLRTGKNVYPSNIKPINPQIIKNEAAVIIRYLTIALFIILPSFKLNL